MRRVAATVLLTALVLSSSSEGALAQDWQLVWADEFDGTAVDDTRWSFEIGDGCPELCGWGNSEEQYYTADNATVEGGFLRITAKQEQMGGREYTSARMRTLGKGDWLYGRLEVRAKLPKSNGYWPAIWMLPTDNAYGNWAASGEIDIMELFGSDPTTVHGTIHYGGESPGNTFEGGSYRIPRGNFSMAFHDFAIEWVPGEIRWYVDGNLYHTQIDWYSTADRFPAPFDEPFHLLLNVAIGGNAGSPDGTSIFPQSMEVDYVRVYQSDNELPTATHAAPGSLMDGDDLTITVTAADTDGDVSRAAFFVGDAFLGLDDEAPFEWTISSAAAGCYEVRARVTDNMGGQTWTAPSTVTVDNCVQAPYLAQRSQLPSRVEAEYFDLGGEGVAFHDVDGLNAGNDGGNDLRVAEGVDLEFAPGRDAGYRVRDFEAGEWLEYQVEVSADGPYNIDIRLKSDAGATVSVKLGELTLVDGLEIGVLDWGTSRVSNVAIPSGPSTLRIEVTQGSIVLDYVTFLPYSEPPPAGSILIEDFTDGTGARWGFHLADGQVTSDAVGLEPYMKATFSGGGGDGSAFYGVTWLNLPDDAQALIPADPWVSVRLRHNSVGTTVDSYVFEITVREDTDGNGWTDGEDDSRRHDVPFTTAAFNDEWMWVGAPLDAFTEQVGSVGDGFLEVALDEIVLVVSQVAGPNPSSVEIDIDRVMLTTGPVNTGTDGLADLPSGINLSAVFPNPAAGFASVTFDVNEPGAIHFELFDVLGRRIAVLDEGRRSIGRHHVRLNTESLSAGVYLLRLRQAGTVRTKQFIVTR